MNEEFERELAALKEIRAALATELAELKKLRAAFEGDLKKMGKQVERMSGEDDDESKDEHDPPIGTPPDLF